jgi:uncharacterized membrane protein
MYLKDIYRVDMTMNSLFRALLAVHICAGTIALLVAPGAMVTVKGGLWHRRWGKAYVWAMLVIAVTGAVMSFLRPNLFLLMVAVFSFYLVFSGYRVLHRKKPGQRGTFADKAVTFSMLLAGIAFLGYGAQRLLTSSFGVVPILFGAIALSLSGRELVKLRHPPTEPRWWWFSHMRNMLAAYLATVTAFSVVNLTFLPDTVRWIWPTVLGSAGIIIWTGYYRRKFARQTVPARNVGD